jgi:hypothetical protein
MPRVWSRLSLLVLALFVQLGVARAVFVRTVLVRTVLVRTVLVSAGSLAVAAEGFAQENRWSPASASPIEGEPSGAPSGDSNGLEQDGPLDDLCDSECALLPVLALQQASEGSKRLNAGAGVGARPTALDGPFKPPRA